MLFAVLNSPCGLQERTTGSAGACRGRINTAFKPSERRRRAPREEHRVCHQPQEQRTAPGAAAGRPGARPAPPQGADRAGLRGKRGPQGPGLSGDGRARRLPAGSAGVRGHRGRQIGRRGLPGRGRPRQDAVRLGARGAADRLHRSLHPGRAHRHRLGGNQRGRAVHLPPQPRGGRGSRHPARVPVQRPDALRRDRRHPGQRADRQGRPAHPARAGGRRGRVRAQARGAVPEEDVRIRRAGQLRHVGHGTQGPRHLPGGPEKNETGHADHRRVLRPGAGNRDLPPHHHRRPGVRGGRRGALRGGQHAGDVPQDRVQNPQRRNLRDGRRAGGGQNA